MSDLSTIPTADIVRELCSREGITWMGVPEKYPHLSRYWSIGDEMSVDSIGGTGPARIIVVQGVE